MCWLFKWLFFYGCLDGDDDDSQPVLKQYKEKHRVWEDMQSEAIHSIKVNDTDWPQVYAIPDDKHQTPVDVIAARGYDPTTQTEIGSGGCGRVYRVVRTADGVSVALKTVVYTHENRDRERDRIDFLRTEIAIMSQIKHKNIVPLFDKFIVNNMCYLVMELANGGDLQEVVNSTPNGLSELRAKEYFVQFARAVAHLHHQKTPVAHRDVKLNNVLIFKQTDQIVAKLTDFGLSRVLGYAGGEHKDRKAIGTQPYFGPQMLKLKIHTECLERQKFLVGLGKVKTVNPIKADVWSLGVCLYYMCSKRYPYNSRKDNWKDISKAIKRQMNKQYTHLNGSPELNDLIDGMFAPSGKRRLTIDGVLSHRWLSGVPDVMKPDDRSSLNV